MLIVMQEHASEAQIAQAIEKLVGLGFDIYRTTGVHCTVLGVVGDLTIEAQEVELIEGVREVLRVTLPYPLASRSFCPTGTQIKIKDVVIGDREVVVLAGSMMIENREQIQATAAIVAQSGARILRSKAFRFASSSEEFSGLGEEGLQQMRHAARAYDLLVASTIEDAAHLEVVNRYADLIEVAASQIRNFDLLGAVARLKKPVIVRREQMAAIEDALLAAECLLRSGNQQVMLCEAGTRSFEPRQPQAFDVAAIVTLKKLTHLPILADVSHAAGRRDRVAPLAQAAIAAGADGVLLAVHPQPDAALCERAQALTPEQFFDLLPRLQGIAEAVARQLSLLYNRQLTAEG